MTATRVILDTSAVLKYAAGSINVGEVLAEVADEAATFGVPLACLIEAARQMSTDDLLGLYVLEAHKQGAILAGRPDQWRIVAGLARALGRADLASALLAAHENSAYVLTGEPQAYGEPGGDLVITI